ncbi:hypothetical protein HMN09_00921400 [Mycena chlorophos]|uniref:F-box domain-containing protein n=1 Tax=Mycena chlorophos TaxID=658473 RepID=A0A8H6SJ46_MYCCL|nr:hypothetical protein HMN09_00921400 [Mycena chlorophos]
MREERRRVEWERDAAVSVAAPIRKLPVELLAEVFELLTPAWPARRTGNGEDAAGDPTDEVDRLRKGWLISLSQVCCHWRHVALTTPRLWAPIAIESGLWKDPSCPLSPAALLDLVQLSITRSAHAPLTLRVITDNIDENAEAIFNLLTPHSARWREVDIRVDRSNLWLLDCVKGRLGMLEKLGLHTRAAQIEMFAEAPRLREVVFWGYSTCALSLPYGTLSTFRACGGPMETTTSLTFLSPLSSAASAYFYINATRLPRPSIALPHVISRVRRFGMDLGCCYEQDVAKEAVGRLFGGLTFEGLGHLHLKARRGHPAPVWDQGAWEGLAARSGFDRPVRSPFGVDAPAPLLPFSSLSASEDLDTGVQAGGLASLTLRVYITTTELLGVLRGLPVLEKLDLADVALQEKMVVVGDELLRGLIWGGMTKTKRRVGPPVPEPDAESSAGRVTRSTARAARRIGKPEREAERLLPALHRIYFRTVVAFTEDVMLEFVRSRTSVAAGKDKESEREEREEERDEKMPDTLELLDAEDEAADAGEEEEKEDHEEEDEDDGRQPAQLTFFSLQWLPPPEHGSRRPSDEFRRTLGRVRGMRYREGILGRAEWS